MAQIAAFNPAMIGSIPMAGANSTEHLKMT